MEGSGFAMAIPSVIPAAASIRAREMDVIDTLSTDRTDRTDPRIPRFERIKSFLRGLLTFDRIRLLSLIGPFLRRLGQVSGSYVREGSVVLLAGRQSNSADVEC